MRAGGAGSTGARASPQVTTLSPPCDPFLDGGCRPHAYSALAATAALRSARRRLTRPRPVPLPRQPCAETIVEAEEEDVFYIYLLMSLE